MKKLIFVFIICFGFQNLLLSQQYLKINISPSFSNYLIALNKNDDLTYIFRDFYEKRYIGKIGGTLDLAYKVQKNDFSMNLGIGFSNIGDLNPKEKYDGPENRPLNVRVETRFTTSIYYLTIPVGVEYFLSKNKKTSIFLNYRNDIYLANKEKIVSFNVEGTKIDIDIQRLENDLYRRYNPTIELGYNKEYAIKDKYIWGVSPFFNFKIFPVMKDYHIHLRYYNIGLKAYFGKNLNP